MGRGGGSQKTLWLSLHQLLVTSVKGSLNQENNTPELETLELSQGYSGPNNVQEHSVMVPPKVISIRHNYPTTCLSLILKKAPIEKKPRFGRPGSRKPVSVCLMAGASTKTFSQPLNPKARSSDIPYPKFTQGPCALGPKYILFCVYGRQGLRVRDWVRKIV